MTAVPLYQVDAFTEKPFGGNPAAVCLLTEPAPDTWCQAVAREMNLSETAFLSPRDGAFDLRWFTPEAEVDLCGHATLAAAHVLWESGTLKASELARFQTRSGELTASREDGRIWLDFPADPDEPIEAPDGLAQALSVPPVYVGRGRFDLLVELADENRVRMLEPRFDLLKALPFRGIIVTAKSDQAPFDFVSRFFAPVLGVPEDPVTGSAHCTLACYWSRRLDRLEFTACQASARGGVVQVKLRGDRVLLGGTAVLVLRGELIA